LLHWSCFFFFFLCICTYAHMYICTYVHMYRRKSRVAADPAEWLGLNVDRPWSTVLRRRLLLSSRNVGVGFQGLIWGYSVVTKWRSERTLVRQIFLVKNTL
jgi:hypothetical protein